MSDKRTEERNEAFDSAMREKIAGYEPTVPHALWNRISAELNETESHEALYIPRHVPAAATSKWKVAVAAAILITLGAGSILFTTNTKNEISSTSVPAATKVATPAVNATTTPVVEIKTVAQTAPVITKHATTVAKQDDKIADAIPATDTKAETATTEDSQLAATPLAPQTNLVDVSNIPVYSLNKLTAPAELNDEITVIKSVTAKKKHHRHNDDESTKVIMLGKKYDSQPDIRYQVPVRF